MKRFNLNSSIKVKLTDLGKKTIVDYYEPSLCIPRANIEQAFIADKTDADGWTEMQAHVLMAYFGRLAATQFWGNTKIPFDPTVLIDENDLEDEIAHNQ